MTETIDWITRLALPVLIGFITGVLSAFISWIRERANMVRENRELQIRMSIELCKKIIDALDSLYARMYSDAWHIAWRKANGQKFNYSDELLKQDEERWEQYEALLSEWRSQLIGFETELKGFFGNNGYEAFLFLSCVDIIDHLSEMVWKVYYNPHSSESDAVPIFLWKNGSAAVERDILDTSEDGQKKSMELYFTRLETLKYRIATLSSTMIHCIQVMNVGNLIDQPEPIPEEDRKEAEALLGGRVYKKSFEAHKPLKERILGSKNGSSSAKMAGSALPV